MGLDTSMYIYIFIYIYVRLYRSCIYIYMRMCCSDFLSRCHPEGRHGGREGRGQGVVFLCLRGGGVARARSGTRTATCGVETATRGDDSRGRICSSATRAVCSSRLRGEVGPGEASNEERGLQGTQPSDASAATCGAPKGVTEAWHCTDRTHAVLAASWLR